MIVTLTTIVDSHECLDYRAGRYCARKAQVSSKKNEILQSSSSGAGSVTQWIGSESTQYEWGFEKGFSALAAGFQNSIEEACSMVKSLHEVDFSHFHLLDFTHLVHFTQTLSVSPFRKSWVRPCKY